MYGSEQCEAEEIVYPGPHRFPATNLCQGYFSMLSAAARRLSNPSGKFTQVLYIEDDCGRMEGLFDGHRWRFGGSHFDGHRWMVANFSASS